MTTTSQAKIIGLDSYRDNTDGGDDFTSIAKLALKLQQSIELPLLLRTFCEEIAYMVPCDSVSYVHDNELLNFQTGESRAHHCKYQLVLEGDKLGEIICTRTKPFSIRETNLLERLLSLLIYPLRNSLLYNTAISQARKDPLTEICNRAAFDEAFAKELSSFKRHQANFAMMIIDIDHFKLVNDTHGHIAGDKVLKSVAQIIQNTIRRSDEVFRYGGEEFVVILSNTNQGGARFLAERVKKQIEQLVVHVEEEINVTASIGISSSDILEDASEILEQADRALYQAKDQGRNRVVSCP